MAPQTQDNRGNSENLNPEYASVAQALKGVDLPQDKEGLKRCAQENNADERIMQFIQNMPDQEYQTMADIIAETDSQGGRQ